MNDPNANFAAIRLSHNLQKQLPVWFQTGAIHNPISNKEAKCLLLKHQMKMLADLIRTSVRIRNNPTPQPHRLSNFCTCMPCLEDCNMNCIHPSLTRRRKDQNLREKAAHRRVTFSPSITSKNKLSECFRIFADP